MKKIILILALVFTTSTVFTSCREKKTTDEKIEEAIDNIGDELENASDDVKDAVEDVKDEIKEIKEEAKKDSVKS
ncbi:hypothetical protein [Hwangdonia lutea]|uniref:YtxH domain-containing protein n=1 Tax=Hwangdonia lutea TaxID=3075823 RepID=A0AA97ENI5_9FLAO|nr:hypothetical protein [Hwangdonia sp. SCSIO 19198]WOD43315.1 hypothetical protein RNZ46_15100 [Hwangdonia sp. SCSIO 19198]